MPSTALTFPAMLCNLPCPTLPPSSLPWPTQVFFDPQTHIGNGLGFDIFMPPLLQVCMLQGLFGEGEGCQDTLIGHVPCRLLSHMICCSAGVTVHRCRCTTR